MSGKLISANYILNLIEDNEPMNWNDTDEEIQEVADWCYFKKLIENAPAVDAVEVVRCKDCKYWEPMNKGSWMCINRTDGVCRTLMELRLAERYMTDKDHFCGFGERREENESI